MYSEEIQYRRSPKAPFDRRGYAFLIDFVVVWIVSSLITNLFLEFIVFCLLWLILRVVVVEKNKGQSLGRWAMDLKIADIRLNRRPDIIALTKREGTIAVASFLAMMGFKISFADFLLFLLFSTPLIVDGVTSLTDDEYNRAFHDRISNTVIIQTRRGFSLDLRLKKWYKMAKKNWQNRPRKQ